MARKKTPQGAANSDALAPDDGTAIPRIKMGETGFNTLKVRNGKMLEAANVAFRYPQMIRMVEEMVVSPPVAIGLNAQNTLFNRGDIVVEPLPDENEVDKARRDYLSTVLHDMEASWQQTLQSISSYKEYGHSIQEIVLRRRLYSAGSKYNDGLVGLKALKNRPQNSIAKWNFSTDGRTLESVSQSIAGMENSARFANLVDQNGFIVIPREKFLLFRCDATTENPEGNSVLKPVFLAYKQLSLITDQLMTGISKDVAGTPYAQLPPQYLSPDAPADQKAVYAATQGIVKGLADGTQAGVVFPKMVDPETKQDLFNLSFIEHKTGKAYDLPAIIKLLQNNILSVLSADSITMGESGGSLSLQDGNTNLLALQVAYRHSEVANILNTELVPLLWRMNSWSTDRMPKFKFKDLTTMSAETYSKAVQRLASTSQLEVSRGILNKHYEMMGWPTRPDDEPVDIAMLPAMLTGQISSGGEGMAVGTSGEGTSTNAVDNGQNASDNNNDNKG